tara:strand:+ start:803 stop:1048 length:246 start_codon:yes stop_codon:yes gene_type:complete
MKNLIHQTITYTLFVACLSLLVILFADKKKLKELQRLEPIPPQDTTVMWFDSQMPLEYETIECATVDYDWGREVLVFFTYK